MKTPPAGTRASGGYGEEIPVRGTNADVHSGLPLVLLIDVDPSVVEEVKGLGYPILEGTFGRPYEVDVDGKLHPLGISHRIPEGFQEADIVIIGIETDLIDEDDVREYGHESTNIPWYKATHPIVDPRGFIASRCRDRFDEMFQKGTAFVVLSGPRIQQQLWHGNHVETLSNFDYIPNQSYHLYSFLSCLQTLGIRDESGSYIELSDLGESYKTPTEGGRFEVALVNAPAKEGILARNKDGHAVSFAYYAPNSAEDRKGLLLFCHQVPDPVAMPRWALEDVLPTLAPHLYPEQASESWLRAEPYEDPQVGSKLAEIQEVQETAKVRVAALQAEVDTIREDAAPLMTLLTATGDELVRAVKIALEELGFGSVQDMDGQLADGERKKEDLRISDEGFVALCEVKGLNGLPKEEDLTAVVKYMSMAVRELRNPDVRGLAFINHQRLVAPLKRTNKDLYDPAIEGHLVEQNVGVMSTWDLFKLLRSYRRCGWNHSEVREIFESLGRLRPIPPGFSELGPIGHVWKQSDAFGVVLTSGSVSVGDRYLVEASDGVWEGVVESLQVGDSSVETAVAGNEVGLKGSLDISRVREGSIFYAEPKLEGS